MGPNYYAIIPATVRYDKELTPNAKLLYGEITALSNQEGYCWATNSYFAKLYGVTTVSISKWISQLEKKGYVKTKIIYEEKSKQIKERRIYIEPPIKEKFNTPKEKVKEGIKEKFNNPIKEKFKDNNTRLNNTTNTTSEYSSGGLSDVIKFYEINGFGLINLYTKEDLVDLSETYTPEWVLDAMKIAVDNNARKLSYVRAILKKWKADGKDTDNRKSGGNLYDYYEKF